MNNKKIVYVTGCLGFIGSYVTTECLKRGWYVRGIDKISYAANVNLLEEFSKNDRFVFEQKDINDIEFLYDCDYIINTAAETHVGNSIVRSDDFVKSNINGVHNLLELLRNYRLENNRIPTLIHFSTDEVYGDIDSGMHYETDILKPSNPYSSTKAAADMLIQAWHRTYSIPYVIVRPTNNYGIGQYTEKLIPKACKYLNIGRKIPLHNNGTPIRNWLHAQDTANAIMTIIDANVKNEIFNICGSLEKNNLEVIQKIVNLYFKNDTDVKNYVDFSIGRPGQDIRYSLNDDKLRNLGWAPIMNFEEELKEIIKFYKYKFIW